MAGLTPILLLALANTAVVPVPVDNDWWRTRHAAMVERMEKPADLAFIGDSITNCFGGDPDTGEDFGDRGDDSWQLFYGDRNVANLGISGDQTQHVLWRLDRYAKFNPKVAVIMIGTNNVGRNTPSEIAEGVQAIVEKVKTKSPRTKVLLLGIFPRSTADSPERKAVVEVNDRLKGWSEKGNANYLDIGRVFLDGNGEIPDAVMPDKLHPFDYGYRLWAMAMEPTLARLLGDKSKTRHDPMNSALVPVTHNRDYPLYDGPARHPFIVEWTRSHRADLVFLGDSITHRWGGDPMDPTDNTPKTGLTVWNSTFGKYRPANLGCGWDRTENLLWRLEQGEIDRLDPKGFVLLIGTNNVGLNTPEEIRDGVAAIVDLIHAKKPKAKVLLLGLLPRGQTPEDGGRLAAGQINRLLSRIRRPFLTYKDIGKPLLEKDGSLLPETMPDFLHPTASAYGKMAEQIEPVVAKWF